MLGEIGPLGRFHERRRLGPHRPCSGSTRAFPLPLAILAALSTGAVIGSVYALLRTQLGMPSFVSTLAGLLALLGLQLYMLGSTGSINLPYGSWMVNFGQLLMMPAWASHAVALLPWPRHSRDGNSQPAPAPGSQSLRWLLLAG